METDSREKTLRMAANVLEYRHRSSRALYQRLLEKGAEEQDAAYAVARLQELGYLNDGEYGNFWCGIYAAGAMAPCGSAVI